MIAISDLKHGDIIDYRGGYKGLMSVITVCATPADAKQSKYPYNWEWDNPWPQMQGQTHSLNSAGGNMMCLNADDAKHIVSIVGNESDEDIDGILANRAKLVLIPNKSANTI